MPPVRFARLVRAWERREACMDRRFALIACVLANIHRAPTQRAYQLNDFMPAPAKTAEQSAKDKAADQQLAQRQMASALNMLAKTLPASPAPACGAG